MNSYDGGRNWSSYVKRYSGLKKKEKQERNCKKEKDENYRSRKKERRKHSRKNETYERNIRFIRTICES